MKPPWVKRKWGRPLRSVFHVLQYGRVVVVRLCCMHTHGSAVFDFNAFAWLQLFSIWYLCIHIFFTRGRKLKKQKTALYKHIRAQMRARHNSCQHKPHTNVFHWTKTFFYKVSNSRTPWLVDLLIFWENVLHRRLSYRYCSSPNCRNPS